MTMELHVLEIPLNSELEAELEAVKDDPAAVEEIVKRIANEALSQRDKEEKEAMLKTLREFSSSLRLKLITDALLCVHFLMHAGRQPEAQMILCPTAAILEGEKVPHKVFQALLVALDATNLEREKASCEGCA